jgi:hypothetical protein
VPGLTPGHPRRALTARTKPDNFDPAISDALAPGREIILSDNPGAGRSTGTIAGLVTGLPPGDAPVPAG